MKKVLLLVLSILLLCGCVNINESSYEKIIDEAASSKMKIYNTYRKGYKFYLPVGLYVDETKDYNEVIKNGRETFYMYIDLVGYLNKQVSTYEPNEGSEYFVLIDKGDQKGYAEIKLFKNDKYLVEIMYNYAKIEVMVDESRINECLSSAIIILSSIKYNDAFLEKLSEESLLDYREETVDIFDKKGSGDASHFLEYVEDYDGDREEDEEEFDSDQIKDVNLWD